MWLENARNANEQAARLEAGLRTVPGVEFLFQRQANAVFAKLPPGLATGLRSRGWRFYEFIGSGGCRFMCSWATTPSDVDALIADCYGIGQE